MKKRLIFTKESPDTFKVGDTDSTLSMQLVDTSDDVNAPVDPSSFQSVKMVIRSKDYYLRDLTPSINKDSVTVNSADLTDLPAGSYYFEAWATTKDGKAEVYPDYGFLGFEITQNGYYQSGQELAGVAVDKLRDEFHKYVDDRLAAQKPVDLSDYVKSEQLQDYAKKQDVPVVAYDSEKNTLSINGQSWELQQKIDLSSYAKKSDVPVVGLDVKDRTLSINGVKVDIPAKVDLSSYVTSEQFNEAVQAFPVVTYNSGTNDLEVNGQKVPLVSDQDVNNKLTGYAKKTDLPVLTLDTTKRTLNVNGVSIKIPAEVDLSGYAKTSDVPKVTYDATNKKLTVDGVDVPLTGGQSVDLSGYVTTDELNKDLFGSNDHNLPVVSADSNNNYEVYEQPIAFAEAFDTLASIVENIGNRLSSLSTKINSIAGVSDAKKAGKTMLDFAARKLPVDQNKFGFGYPGFDIDTSTDNVDRFNKIVDPIYNNYLTKINNDTTVADVIKDTKGGLTDIQTALIASSVKSSRNGLNLTLDYNLTNTHMSLGSRLPDDYTLWPVADN